CKNKFSQELLFGFSTSVNFKLLKSICFELSSQNKTFSDRLLFCIVVIQGYAVTASSKGEDFSIFRTFIKLYREEICSLKIFPYWLFSHLFEQIKDKSPSGFNSSNEYSKNGM